METLIDIQFRKVNPEDWVKFRSIRLKTLKLEATAFGSSYEEERGETPSQWKHKLSNIERCFFVAEHNRSFIALAGAKKIAKDNWMIIAVFTLPDFRRRGISQKLIEIIVNHVIAMGGQKISLLVNIQNEIAVNFYKAAGFEIIKIEKNQKLGDGKLHDEYYMEKSLVDGGK